jgi:hypothetical protein
LSDRETRPNVEDNHSADSLVESKVNVFSDEATTNSFDPSLNLMQALHNYGWQKLLKIIQESEFAQVPSTDMFVKALLYINDQISIVEISLSGIQMMWF